MLSTSGASSWEKSWQIASCRNCRAMQPCRITTAPPAVSLDTSEQHNGGPYERRSAQYEHPQVSEDRRRQLAACDRESRSPGAGGRHAQGKRDDTGGNDA